MGVELTDKMAENNQIHPPGLHDYFRENKTSNTPETIDLTEASKKPRIMLPPQGKTVTESSSTANSSKNNDEHWVIPPPDFARKDNKIDGIKKFNEVIGGADVDVGDDFVPVLQKKRKQKKKPVNKIFKFRKDQEEEAKESEKITADGEDNE